MLFSHCNGFHPLFTNFPNQINLIVVTYFFDKFQTQSLECLVQEFFLIFFMLTFLSFSNEISFPCILLKLISFAYNRKRNIADLNNEKKKNGLILLKNEKQHFSPCLYIRITWVVFLKTCLSPNLYPNAPSSELIF